MTTKLSTTHNVSTVPKPRLSNIAVGSEGWNMDSINILKFFKSKQLITCNRNLIHWINQTINSIQGNVSHISTSPIDCFDIVSWHKLNVGTTISEESANSVL